MGPRVGHPVARPAQSRFAESAHCGGERCGCTRSLDRPLVIAGYIPPRGWPLHWGSGRVGNRAMLQRLGGLGRRDDVAVATAPESAGRPPRSLDASRDRATLRSFLLRSPRAHGRGGSGLGRRPGCVCLHGRSRHRLRALSVRPQVAAGPRPAGARTGPRRPAGICLDAAGRRSRRTGHRHRTTGGHHGPCRRARGAGPVPHGCSAAGDARLPNVLPHLR